MSTSMDQNPIQDNGEETKSKSKRVLLFQEFVNSLKIKETVVEENFQVNMMIQKEGSSLILAFNNGRKYIFTNEKNEEFSQNSTIINKDDQAATIKDNFSFSLMNIFLYFYSINKNEPFLPKIDLESIVCKNKQDFIDISNHFLQALNSNRRYTYFQQIIWNGWITYWSKNSRQSLCYSSCSGTCNQLCSETRIGNGCLYFYPSNEKQNSYLPVSERIDPSNIFDDQNYWIAGLFDQFIKREKYKFQHTFLSQSLRVDPSLAQLETNIQNQIIVKFTSDDIFQIDQLINLYQIDKQQIKSICILSINKQSIPKEEGERQELYDFILSLPNLKTLELQFENSLYHPDLENDQIEKSVTDITIIVANFAQFLLKLKVTNLSLLLDRFCFPNPMNLQPIILCLPQMNQKVKVLHISINNRRMIGAQYILQNLRQMKQLQWLHLEIKKQWLNFSFQQQGIWENLQKWEIILKKQCARLVEIEIE